jgi:hypothetical protein
LAFSSAGQVPADELEIRAADKSSHCGRELGTHLPLLVVALERSI